MIPTNFNNLWEKNNVMVSVSIWYKQEQKIPLYINQGAGTLNQNTAWKPVNNRYLTKEFFFM